MVESKLGEGARWKDTCVCGNRLKPTYNKDLDLVFWNCFQCFPISEEASREQTEKLIRETIGRWD